MLRFICKNGNRRTVFPSIMRLFSERPAVVHEKDADPQVQGTEAAPKSLAKRRKPPFNRTAVLDLFIEKFDPNLLYFPEVLGKEDWEALIERGCEVEQSLLKINYDEILSTGKLSNETVQQLRAMDLFRSQVPKEYGGIDMTMTENTYIHEVLSIRPSIARVVSENAEMGIRIIKMFGTEEQKRRLLPELANGEKFISFALLEDSSALLDVKSYTGTNATDINGNFLVNGKKCWVYNGSIADYFIILAMHSVIDKDGALVLYSLFLVDRTSDGITVHEPIEKKWFRGLDVCDITFKDVGAARENIIGGFGKGMHVLKKLLQLNKPQICAECTASMKRLVHDAVEKCTNVEFLGKPIPEFRYVESAIGELSSLTYAVESLTYYLAGRGDSYDEPDLTFEVMLAKLFATEALPEALKMYFNLVGKTGYERGSFVEELVQNAHYYSVLDDNTNNLKLFHMSEALQHFSRRIYGTLKKIFNPREYPLDKIKSIFTRTNMNTFRRNIELGSTVEGNLYHCAENLEHSIYQLIKSTDAHWKKYGNFTINLNQEMIMLADMLINIYAMIATLARANRAIRLKLPKWEEDLSAAVIFGIRTRTNVDRLSSTFLIHGADLFHNHCIGKTTFKTKTYALEHPITRNF